MTRRVLPGGLRGRSAAAFALMALALSLLLSVATYELTRWYLLDKRESLALRQVTLNAQVVRGQLAAQGAAPTEVLEALQSSDAQAILRIGEAWYSAVVQLDESSVPEGLRQLVDDGEPGRQRAVVDGTSYLVYGMQLADSGAQYFEFVSAEEYERTLSVLGVVLAIAATATTVAGAAAGWFASRRVLQPLREVADSASRISGGELSHRMDAQGDVDLGTVALAFNEMAANVEARIEREHRFTADVSHELRTPLTALGAAVSLAKRSKSDDRFEETMRIAEEQLQHLTRLTVELLEISRIDSGVGELDVGEVDVAQLVGRVLEQAGVDRSVLSTVSEDAGRWVLDGVRIERAVANLVENALRYGGGVTRVLLDTDDEGRLRITVDDAGPGVPVDERAAIFGRFNRGSMPQPRTGPKGTGLGLAIVEEHVRLHGGTVSVDDAPDGGARFVVCLPRGDREL